MSRKKLKCWQPILFVSPYEIKVQEIPQTSTNGIYKVINAFTAPRALGVIKDDFPAIIVINVFMDKYIRSIQGSINLIERARQEEFNTLIIATSSVPISSNCQANIISSGANTYLPSGFLERDLATVVEKYETIMLCEGDYLERNPDIANDIREAVLFINKPFLKTYFKRNPGIKEIKIDPWGINRFKNAEEIVPDDCGPNSQCFEFSYEEVA